MTNKILIERVANGWIIRPFDFGISRCDQSGEYLVFNNIDDLAANLSKILALTEESVERTAKMYACKNP